MKKFVVHAALAAALLAGAGAAPAQSQPMKTNEVTEAAIVDALTPPAGAVAGGPRTRGFQPGMRPKINKPSSAAVLITFVTNSAELTAESRSALDVIARALRSGKLSSLNFVVEGHADPRGDADHNMELSKARAEAVVGYLVAEHGIDRQRLIPVGKGSSEPLNKAQLDAPENRRVTFVTQTN